jgi:small-conductance mechanosensitive channel
MTLPPAYPIAAAIAAGGLAIFWITRAILIRKFAKRQEMGIEANDLAFDLARRTKIVLLVLPFLFLGIRITEIALQLPHARLLRLGARLSLIAQVALWVAGIADFWLRRYRRTRVEPESQTLAHVFGLVIATTVWSVAVLVALENLGFSVTTVVAGLGIGGVAVALALQNILGDLFASLSIIIDKPFVVGDSIMVDRHAGTVEQIGMKTTRLRAVGGEELILGNGDLLKSRVHNFKRMTHRRALLRVGVAWQTPPDTLERIPLLIRSSIEKQQRVKFERAHFVAFAAGAHEFEAVYYVESPEQAALLDAQQAVNLDLMRTFEREGVVLGAPSVALRA